MPPQEERMHLVPALRDAYDALKATRIMLKRCVVVLESDPSVSYGLIVDASAQVDITRRHEAEILAALKEAR